MELPTLKCLRCGHVWTPRKPVSMVCPKCKTPYWNIPKQSKDGTGTWSDTPPQNWQK